MIKNIRAIITVTILLGLNTNYLFGQQTAQISIPFSVYDNAGGNKILNFGLDQTASDSLDPQLGESDLPPLPPAGAFDVRFILPINNFNGSLSSWKDYRYAPSFPYSGSKEHRLRYQSAQGATVFYFSWDFPPEVTGLLQDVVTGNIINVSLSGSGVYELTDFVVFNQLKLTITYNNIITGIDWSQPIPTEFKVEQNYPNPFNPSTRIKFDVSKFSFVNISVYNLLGEKIVTLINETLPMGYYEVEFNGNNLTSGVYIARIRSGNFIKSIKMILSK